MTVLVVTHLCHTLKYYVTANEVKYRCKEYLYKRQSRSYVSCEVCGTCFNKDNKDVTCLKVTNTLNQRWSEKFFVIIYTIHLILIGRFKQFCVIVEESGPQDFIEDATQVKAVNSKGFKSAKWQQESCGTKMMSDLL